MEAERKQKGVLSGEDFLKDWQQNILAMIIFNFGAKFVAFCRTVYISMEYLETNIDSIDDY